MFEFISTLFGSTHQFPDGSIIRPINRDEYIFTQADGKSVIVYVYKTGPETGFDRIILKSSIDKWLGVNLEPEREIAPDEREEIISKILNYKKFKGDKIGLE